MWIMTSEGWRRLEPQMIHAAPKKGNTQVYWWMGLCPINPKDLQEEDAK